MTGEATEKARGGNGFNENHPEPESPPTNGQPSSDESSAARDTVPTGTPDELFPMPEGYIQRLNAGALTNNDLVWQALIDIREPSRRELVLREAANSHQRWADAARKQAERMAIERGAGTTPDPTDTWQARLTPIGRLEIAPSEDLLLGILHPTGHTLLFGMGEAGKGTIAAWLALRLYQEDKRVLIVDFEHHPEEWQPRLQSLGYDGADNIQYYNPAPIPIWDQAEAIAAAAKNMRADYAIIDSLVFACLTDTSGGDPMHVSNYNSAVIQIGLPTLSIAHINKNAKDPKYPFGSIFWHNAARTTWRLDHLEVATRGTEPSRKVTLTCCKRNDGPHPAKLVAEVIYSHGANGLPRTVDLVTYHETQANRITEILREHGPNLDTSQIAAIYNAERNPDDENARELDAKHIGRVMTKHTKATARKPALFRVDNDKKWSLLEPKGTDPIWAPEQAA